MNPYAAKPERRPEGYTTLRVPQAGGTTEQSGKLWPRVGPLRVWLNPGHGRALLALSYELCWATTWMDEANRWIGPVLGLPELPFVDFGDALLVERPDEVHWKTELLVAYAGGRPFAWVDDEHSAADHAYVSAHHTAPALLHHVNPRIGLRGGVDGNEMCGGGGWDPGEATDDTQMGLLIAASLLEHGGLDLPDVFERFRRWAAADPKDIGILTETVLTSGLPWDRAAEDYYAHNHLAAGNGSLMRALPAALYYARTDQPTRVGAARRISALTHADPSTGWGCVIHQELVIAALDGAGIDTVLPDALALVEEPHRTRWATVLAPGWHPNEATESNGAVWPTLGIAVWALRTTSSFEDALRAVVDLGGDTDTVAAVTGSLAGAIHGLAAIPTRWTAAVHTPLPGFSPRIWHATDLIDLAHRLTA